MLGKGLERHPRNPIVSPADLEPSHPNFEIISTINAGAVEAEGRVVLLLRVAERVIQESQEQLSVPQVILSQGESKVATTAFSLRDSKYDFSDPRVIYASDASRRIVALTSLSHLRLATSENGVDFRFQAEPWLFPSQHEEGWGC
jgi:predicted GH43/DUF377 family glycosyl hydrolase